MPIRPDHELAVHASGLCYSYGSYRAVRDVSLHAHHGEVFALLGTNGAGKTTALELIQGYRRPDSGKASVLGLDPFRQRRPLRRRTGFMLQEAGFLTEMTVQEMLGLWRSISGRRDDPDELMERVDLAHRAHVRLDKLSGGEKRRMDIALAVWGSPELVVLDEPTTGLDPESRRRLWGLVNDLRASGATILLTTHYLEEAEALADRLAIMHEGRVAIAGTMREVLDSRPATITAHIPADSLPAEVGSAFPADTLPRLAGTMRVTPSDGETDRSRRELTVETPALQHDLTDLLTWARERQIELTGLHAQSATLENLFHAIRAGSERMEEEAAGDRAATEAEKDVTVP